MSSLFKKFGPYIMRIMCAVSMEFRLVVLRTHYKKHYFSTCKKGTSIILRVLLSYANKNILKCLPMPYKLQKDDLCVLFQHDFNNLFNFINLQIGNHYITEGKERIAGMGSFSYTYIGCGCDWLNSISCLFYVANIFNNFEH